LSIAQGCLDAGDRTKALEAVDAALAIDPDFLAAHSLRDRILASPEPPPVAPPSIAAWPQPAVSSDGYAKFEARARRRRVDRRIDAARAAIERRRLKEAAVAIDEVIELDPNVPELAELIASFDEFRRAAAVSHRGRWVAAAAAFVMALFGASWLQQSRPLESRPMVAAAPLVDVPAPTPRVETAIVDVAPTGVKDSIAATGQRENRREIAASVDPNRNVSPEPEEGPNAEPPRLANPEPIRIPESPIPPESRTSTPEPVRIPSPEPLVAARSSADDAGLVRQALQRYRTAYDGLDAQSAQAVYPAVNQAALARAFDGLESQTLTFDACDVQLRGDAASATCRGTARYVTKIGNREPRTEPRTWNFTLRKAGSDWKIDSARADR